MISTNYPNCCIHCSNCAQDTLNAFLDYHMGSIYTSWSDWSPCDSENGCKNSRQRFCSTDDKTKCPNVGLYGVQTDFKVCSKEECYRKRLVLSFVLPFVLRYFVRLHRL